MATELIATGTGAASSSDLAVSAGTPVTVALKGADTGAVVTIEVKDDTGAYVGVGGTYGELNSENPVLMISAPGTYRFSRPAYSAACGVFSA